MKKKSIEEMFRKVLLKIDHFHRVKKDALLYTKRGQYLLPWKRTEKYYAPNGSTYIALLSYFIKVYITYAMFWYTWCKNCIIQLEITAKNSNVFQLISALALLFSLLSLNAVLLTSPL